MSDSESRTALNVLLLLFREAPIAATAEASQIEKPPARSNERSGERNQVPLLSERLKDLRSVLDLNPTRHRIEFENVQVLVADWCKFPETDGSGNDGD